MTGCSLVSAIRLPNNLFSDYAGTDVGSDLIILQRKSENTSLSPREQDFIESRKLSNGISINNLFRDFSRVVQTHSKVDTDPYGKPAIVFTHEGGIDGIARDLGQMLKEDFARHLDLRHYHIYTHQEEIKSAAQLDWEENPLGLEDVFSDEELEEIRLSNEQQLTLEETRPTFNQETSRSPDDLDPFWQAVEDEWFPEEKKFWNQEEKGQSRVILQEENHYKNGDGVQQDTLFKLDEFKEPTSEVKVDTVSQAPVITLYDLFGFSQEERSQVKKPKKKVKRAKPNVESEQALLFMDWREEMAYEAAQKREQEKQVIPIPYYLSEKMPAHYREGSLITDENNRIGYLRDTNGFQPIFHPLQLTATQQAKASLYIEIRDTYHHLYSNEATRMEANPALREMLNRLYDDFIRRFGNINDPKNLSLIKMDAGGTEILSLERYIDGKAVKADIFRQPVAFNPNEITHARNAREALTASLNKYATVNLEYMAELTGGTSEELLDELKGTVYFNPMIAAYEIKDKFISGNVISKAELVERFLESHADHKAAKESLSALHEAIPRPILFDELDFNFGERWIPTGIYSKYASYLFDTDVSIHYAPSRDEYTLTTNSKNVKIWDQFAVKTQSRTFDGIALMKHALHNTSPDITKKVNKYIDGELREVKIRDAESIQLANSKIDEIRNGFTDWLNEQSEEFKERLAEKYNRTFNCFVRPDYDGSHQSFPGLDLKGLGIPDLYKSQKDAVWMDILNGGGIIDHEVGGGKTLIMCVSSYEKKRLGLVNKPVIIALKANVHEIAQTYCTAYPNAKVLYPGKEDFTPAKRIKIFHEMKNNNWDAIILTHEQFGMIPQSPEIQRQILQAELDSVEENLELLRREGKEISRAMEKGLIKRQQNLEAKLERIAFQIENRKDDTVNFRLMGIDHLYVDESHRFKNLTFTTRHDRVAGLGNAEGSQRALNMLFALRTIQERTGKDLGATFLSGTTISNSLTELYLLFKYLRPNELERQGINTFDAWAAIFAKKSIDYEFSVTNEIVQKERFRYFIKVPELAAFYAEVWE